MNTDLAYIQELRRREWKGEPLSDQEQADLSAFYARMNAEEEALLAPAFERWEQERIEREEKLRRLEAIRDQMQASLNALQDLRRQIETLKAEEESLLASVKT
jgi:hypothetical protein